MEKDASYSCSAELLSVGGVVARVAEGGGGGAGGYRVTMRRAENDEAVVDGTISDAKEGGDGSRFRSSGELKRFTEEGVGSRRALKVSTSTKKKADDPSKAIAEMMLQGWAMMSEHCPECVAPLLRNRKKRLFCAVCERWMSVETDTSTAALASSDEARQPPQQKRREVDSAVGGVGIGGGGEGTDGSPLPFRITPPSDLAEGADSPRDGRATTPPSVSAKAPKSASFGGKPASGGVFLSSQPFSSPWSSCLDPLKSLGQVLRDGGQDSGTNQQAGINGSREKGQMRSLDDEHYVATTRDAGGHGAHERICKDPATGGKIGGGEQGQGQGGGRLVRRMAMEEGASLHDGEACRDGHVANAGASRDEVGGIGDSAAGLGFRESRCKVGQVGTRTEGRSGVRVDQLRGFTEEGAACSPIERPSTNVIRMKSNGSGDDKHGLDISQSNGVCKVEDVVSRTINTLAYKMEETRNSIAGACSTSDIRELLGLIVEYANAIKLLQSLSS